MNRRAKLSVGLIAIAFCVGAVVALGLGANEKKTAGLPAAPAGTFLSDVATDAEKKIWNDRGCATCHGLEARGTQMGPDLTKVVPLYLTKHGSAAAAKAALVEYILDPQGSPKLRDDGAQFMNPMPSILKFPGGRREDADAMAQMLLRLVK